MSEETPKVDAGRVPVKLNRVVVLAGTYTGPNMIVGVSVDDARTIIARGWGEAVASTLEHLPELREQPKPDGKKTPKKKG